MRRDGVPGRMHAVCSATADAQKLSICTKLVLPKRQEPCHGPRSNRLCSSPGVGDVNDPATRERLLLRCMSQHLALPCRSWQPLGASAICATSAGTASQPARGKMTHCGRKGDWEASLSGCNSHASRCKPLIIRNPYPAARGRSANRQTCRSRDRLQAYSAP